MSDTALKHIWSCLRHLFSAASNSQFSPKYQHLSGLICINLTYCCASPATLIACTLQMAQNTKRMCKANLKVRKIPTYFAIACALSVSTCWKHADIPRQVCGCSIICLYLNWRKDVEGCHLTFLCLFVIKKDHDWEKKYMNLNSETS